MPKLTWDEAGTRLFETGVSHGVLYPMDTKDGIYPKGTAWNGLTAITQSPSGAEPTPLYADNIKYLNLMSVEEFGATIEAFMYPDEFKICDGTAMMVQGVYAGQQARTPFGLSYRTIIGNDTLLNAYGYKIHLVYGAMASPSEKNYTTVNDSPEAATFSWSVTTTPVPIAAEGFLPTASIAIDSTKVEKTKLEAFEAILYGTDSIEARLPLPDEVMSLLAAG